MLVTEYIRLSLVITTILHLLFLVLLHTASVSFPFRMKMVVTSKFVSVLILFLWCIPLTALAFIFSAFPNKLFMSASCNNVLLPQTFSWRVYFASALFLPLMLILFNYAYFHIMIKRRVKASRSSRCIQRQNIKASRITFAILMSCLICWAPASIVHLVVCPLGCPFSNSDFNPSVLFIIHAGANLLLIMKYIINPVIFALRHQ